MKQTIAAAVIIAAIVITCIYATKISSGFCDDLKSNITKCMDAAEGNNWSDARIYAEEAKKLLKEKLPILETFLAHQDLNEINNTILKIEAAIKLKNLQICISEANSLIGQLENISSSDALTIANIL